MTKPRYVTILRSNGAGVYPSLAIAPAWWVEVLAWVLLGIPVIIAFCVVLVLTGGSRFVRWVKSNGER
jgi:hypothetical protein